MNTEFVYLDTETTGLNPKVDRIVDIAVVDHKCKPLINTLVNPERRIPTEASRIHGITAGMIGNAPTLEQIEIPLMNAVRGKHVVIYNAAYDLRFLPGFVISAMKKYSCCMIPFAEYYGEWNDYFGNYKWQSLEVALKKVGGTWEGEAHRALADAIACKKVWEFLIKKGVINANTEED